MTADDRRRIHDLKEAATWASGSFCNDGRDALGMMLADSNLGWGTRDDGVTGWARPSNDPDRPGFAVLESGLQDRELLLTAVHEAWHLKGGGLEWEADAVELCVRSLEW